MITLCHFLAFLLYCGLYALRKELLILQIMFNPKVSATDYHRTGKAFRFPDLTLTLCPHCRKRHLKKHGFYRRYYISTEFSGILLIRRHICPECGRTVSSIPFFCHPRRAYSSQFIINILTRFFHKPSTLAACVSSFFADYKVECSRQLLYRYRKRFISNLNFLSLELLHILNLKDFAYENEDRKRARQVLSLIHHTAWTPPDVTLQLFQNSGHSYLTQLHFRV